MFASQIYPQVFFGGVLAGDFCTQKARSDWRDYLRRILGEPSERLRRTNGFEWPISKMGFG